MRIGGTIQHRIPLSGYSRKAIDRLVPMFTSKPMLIEVALTHAFELRLPANGFKPTKGDEIKIFLRTDWTAQRPAELGGRLEAALRWFETSYHLVKVHSIYQKVRMDWPRDAVLRAAFRAFREGKSLEEVQARVVDRALRRIQERIGLVGQSVELMFTMIDQKRLAEVERLCRQKGLNLDSVLTWEVLSDP